MDENTEDLSGAARRIEQIGNVSARFCQFSADAKDLSVYIEAPAPRAVPSNCPETHQPSCWATIQTVVRNILMKHSETWGQMVTFHVCFVSVA